MICAALYVCPEGTRQPWLHDGGVDSCSPVAEGASGAGLRTSEGADHRTYPIPLETLLRTEEAIFYAQLEAGRTLERAGIVVAVGAAALALCFTF